MNMDAAGSTSTRPANDSPEKPLFIGFVAGGSCGNYSPRVKEFSGNVIIIGFGFAQLAKSRPLSAFKD
jgi:hypothetical protein